MFVIGHRGAAGLAPENTLRGIQLAIDLGVPWIEVDVWNVAGELVVFHDRRLERRCSVPGRIADLTMESVSRLLVNGSEPIPTLNEVLDATLGKVVLNIEMKGPDVAETLGRLIKERAITNEAILISSFDHKQLAALRSRNPTVRLAPVLYGTTSTLLPFAASIGAYSVNLSVDFVDKSVVDGAHQAGMKVLVFTVNHDDDIEELHKMGVDGIFSDYPDRALKAVAALS